MNTSGDDYTRSPSSGVTEERWMKKKEALLKSLSKDRSAQKIDRAQLSTEKQRLISEVERLEEQNYSMAKSVKDFELQLSEKRRMSQMLFERSDALKKKLIRFLARERGLLNEIDFFESEKARLSDIYSQVSKSLDTNISLLDSTFNDIGFMKGEMRALIEKMGMLEGEVPVKLSDADNLDEKITRAIKELKNLYNKMQSVERSVKIDYYNKKKTTVGYP